MLDVEIANTLNGLLTEKGDVITAADMDTPAKLLVGTDGQVLTADSTADTGLAWATAGTGGGASPIRQRPHGCRSHRPSAATTSSSTTPTTR